jgi:hypothetical protein
MGDPDLQAVERAGRDHPPVSDDALRRGRSALLARIDEEGASSWSAAGPSPTRRRALRIGLIGSAVAAAVVGVTLLGIPGGRRPIATDPDEPDDGASFDVELARTAFVHGTVDHDPYADTTAMAAASDAVVLGTVVRVRDARVPPPGDTAGVRVDSVLVELRVDREVAGSAGGQVDGRILVEVQRPGATLAEQRAALPAGTRMVAYLGAAQDLRDVPTGAVGFRRPVGLQAVTVQGADGGPLVRPLLGQAADADLDDALPGGEAIGS